jgi:hypothetical protein
MRVILSCTCALLALASTARAGFLPDPSLSTATSNNGHTYIAADGTGPSLASAGLTITVTLRDAVGVPISNFPFQDIWVGSDVPGDVVLCYQGSLADKNTDAAGMTTISGPIVGGGSTQAGLRVYASGLAIDTSPLPISVNSPDINRDLWVDIADLGPFAVDYINGHYDYEIDFNGDGAENLVDLGIFVMHNGMGCR